MKTLSQLRSDFEHMAKSSFFDIERLSCGEYKTNGRNTFILWAGYWECAKSNGVIPPESSALDMNNP